MVYGVSDCQNIRSWLYLALNKGPGDGVDGDGGDEALQVAQPGRGRQALLRLPEERHAHGRLHRGPPVCINFVAVYLIRNLLFIPIYTN